MYLFLWTPIFCYLWALVCQPTSPQATYWSWSVDAGSWIASLMLLTTQNCHIWSNDAKFHSTFPFPLSLIWVSYQKRGFWLDPHAVYIWRCHPTETFSALLALCAGNSPVTGQFLSQRPVTQSFDVFFDVRLNKQLSKQSWGWWLGTPSHSLWCHCNEIISLWCHWHWGTSVICWCLTDRAMQVI